MKYISSKYTSRFLTALFISGLSVSATAQMQTQTHDHNHATHKSHKGHAHQSIQGFHHLETSQVANLKNEASAIILVKADWCSTCHSQIKALQEIKKDKRYQNVKFFFIDYDQQKNLLKTMKVNSQSTIIALKKGQETTRLVAQDSVEDLKKLLDKTL
jgi:thioredoxin 1